MALGFSSTLCKMVISAITVTFTNTTQLLNQQFQIQGMINNEFVLYTQRFVTGQFINSNFHVESQLVDGQST